MRWRRRVTQFLNGGAGSKVIIFINLRNNLDKVADFIQGIEHFASQPPLAVFFNLKIPAPFHNAKLHAKTSEDYLSEESYEEIDRYIFSGLSRKWYLYESITEYRGMHLGMVFEYDFQRFLVPRVKNLEILHSAVLEENPQRIVVFDDTGELDKVARFYADSRNIPAAIVSFTKNSFLRCNQLYNDAGKFLVFLKGILNNLAFKMLAADQDGKNSILIDAKLAKAFANYEISGNFLLCLFEDGLRNRFSLIRRGIPYLPLCFIKDGGVHYAAIDAKGSWDRVSSREHFKDIFKYKGISLWGIVQAELAAFFRNDIPRIIRNIAIVETVARERGIRIAMLRNDGKELERTVILALRLAKIPALVVQHGILAETNGHNRLIADKYAAWGKASVDWYDKAGNPQDSFEITGNPNFDILPLRGPNLSRSQLCKRLNIKESGGIIVFATQQINKYSSFWTDDIFLIMTDKLLSAMREFPGMQLIIKVDPYENINVYRSRLKEYSYCDAFAVKDIDLYTLIFFSDLLVTLDSTVALEAMIFDKPVITYNLTKRSDRVPYAAKGAALGVYRDEDLTQAIRKALTDKETRAQLQMGRNRFIEEYAYRIDGKAGRRVADIVKRYV